MERFRYADPEAAASVRARDSGLAGGSDLARQRATLAISGGSSPKPMFEMFAKSGFPLGACDIFWVDERCVPPTDPQSNFKMANECWLTPAKFPAANIHRVTTELEPHEAARQYARGCAANSVSTGNAAFDVIHRGMGPDGAYRQSVSRASR